MGAVYFYHLTHSPLDAALPMLLGKARGAGWRIVVRGTDAARMDHLDQKLWMGREEDFLAHGLAGQGHDEFQPILLTVGSETPNQARCLMTVDGADVSAEEVQSFERSCILFDGLDEAAVSNARGQWKTLTEAGCAAQYWSEESGRWEKKAETSV